MKKKLAKLKSYLREARPYKNIGAQVVDLITHKIIINFSPADYYRFGFYKSKKTWDEKRRYVALDGSIYWPFEGNHFKYSISLTDKYIQKNLLKGFGLPTPTLLATVGKSFEINSRKRLYEFLDNLKDDVVIKPISSSGGNNILTLTYIDNTFFYGDKQFTYEMIWNHLERFIERGSLIERKVSNVPSIAVLNPGCLNTYRVVTIKTDDQKWHIAAAALKIGQPGASVDNNAYGGIQLNLDHQGKSCHAYDFFTKLSIKYHPETGVPLLNFQPEGYSEVVALAIHASQCFGFLGTIGWDIAYTTEGAMIIEGNITYGCSSLQRGRPGIINAEIAKGLRRTHLFSRWDKTRLYPGYDRQSIFPWRRSR